MALKDRLKNDLAESLKSGDQLKRLVLGMLMSSIQNKELTKRTQLSKTTKDIDQLKELSQLTDDEVMESISSEVKKRKESIEQFKGAGRDDLAQKEKLEMDILMNYLPEQMSEEEIKAEVQKTISEVNAQGQKDMGKVIGAVMAKLKGKADGGIVSRMVKELLS